jgi:hypothetical protein
MKKVSLLIAMIAFVCGNLFAQSYDFDQYNVGDKVAQSIGQPWTTWSNQPGSSEDAAFSDEQAFSGTNSVKFTYGNDQIFNFNDETTGSYTLDWNMYIPTGKDAYLNIQHNFTGGQDGEWAFGLYFNTADQGTILHVSDAEHPFTFPFDTWFPVHFDIDLDNDAISLTIDGTEVHSWAFSESESTTTPGMRVLDALDFYPPTSASKSVFYIDDFSFVSSQGEEELIGDSFEDYTVGNKIAAEAVALGRDWWTTWSNQPGASNDGTVSNDFASEGSNSGKITSSTDQVLLLGDYETGVYDLAFDVYIAAGNSGYFNVLHGFPAASEEQWKWALQVFINATSDEQGSNIAVAPGHGTVHAGGGAVADLPCVLDEWMSFRVHVDCDNDEATLYFNDEEIVSWRWSLDSFGQEADSRSIAGANFCSVTSSSAFYIDNIHFTRIGGVSAPALSVSSSTIYQELDEDEVVTQTFVITNNGNSIGDWEGYIEFGQGEGGSHQEEIYYDNGEPTNLSGLQTANYIEIANKFPVSAYGGSVMGTKLKSVKYFVAIDSDNILGFTGDLYLRAYKAGTSGMPGELLGEVVVPEDQIVLNEWNTGTFTEDIWLTGYDVFVSAGFQQVDGGYPIVFDNATMVPGVRYLAVGNNNSWYLVDDIWDSNYNFCLHAVCEGTPIPGGWVSMNKNNGSILGGANDEITLTFNTIGMSNGEFHNATLLINTNDAENPEFNIPITLKVGVNAVSENGEQLASIYPNPATSQVNLEGENLNSVAIYNVAGQLVRVVKLDNMVNSIDMNVEAGVYFFSIYDNNGRNSVQRVVIAK